ncbi:MAG: imidazoleglycerol-phosphate dehydratase HisB [Firmicutes bacterium]|jgi:imidazoleglycerol-phosphate dehydratase|nr:imidazoleglycerol-phosphate dehydratase HisB [Bacillota bacterium]
MNRKARIERETKETCITLGLNLDGKGESRLDTGIPFLEHMLELWARHGFFDLEIKADGDLEVEPHHLVEDIGLCLGMALNEALGKKEGISRYGSAILPMDDALVLVAVDFSGRPYLNYEMPLVPGMIGQLDLELIEEFWRAVTNEARMNFHIKLLDGSNRHHAVEALFKGAGRAMHQASSGREGLDGVLSTKGVL